MRSKGEIEAAACERITHFMQEYMGKGPRQIHAHMIEDFLLIRLQGVLNAAEQHLIKVTQPDNGRDLLKRMRSQLLETARPTLVTMIKEITGVKVVSLHHDISTVTSEEIILFMLARAPRYRTVDRI